MKTTTAWDDVHKVHARLADLGVPSQFAVKPPAIMLDAKEAAVLAELADYAVRRGFTRQAALRELASRDPHPFKGDAVTCAACGRSEMFSNHVKEK